MPRIAHGHIQFQLCTENFFIGTRDMLFDRAHADPQFRSNLALRLSFKTEAAENASGTIWKAVEDGLKDSQLLARHQSRFSRWLLVDLGRVSQLRADPIFLAPHPPTVGPPMEQKMIVRHLVKISSGLGDGSSRLGGQPQGDVLQYIFRFVRRSTARGKISQQGRPRFQKIAKEPVLRHGLEYTANCSALPSGKLDELPFNTPRRAGPAQARHAANCPHPGGPCKKILKS